MEPLPDDFYVHDCIITPVVYEHGSGGGENPTYPTPRALAPCKFQQSSRTQVFNTRDAAAVAMGAVLDRTDGTVRFAVNPACKRDDKIAIYTRPDDATEPVLILNCQILGTAVPLRFDSETGRPGSWAVDIQIVN